MTNRSRRGVAITLALVGILISAEIALNLWRGPSGLVEVVNEGAEPIENLVVSLGGSRIDVGRVAPSATARVRFTGAGPRTLLLRFRQRGNALGNYEMPGVDPEQLRRDGMKQVLRIRTNEVERYVDDDDQPETPAARLARNAWKSVEDSLSEMAASP